MARLIAFVIHSNAKSLRCSAIEGLGQFAAAGKLHRVHIAELVPFPVAFASRH
jgi:hypothetical protein